MVKASIGIFGGDSWDRWWMDGDEDEDEDEDYIRWRRFEEIK